MTDGPTVVSRERIWPAGMIEVPPRPARGDQKVKEILQLAVAVLRP
jgi:hypothetical protein